MTKELPTLDSDPDVRLQELLRASRGIELDVLPMSSVKLSKFTLKQLSRRRPVKTGTRRSGKYLRKVKQKMHYQTRRRKKREENGRKNNRYIQLRSRYGEQWKISKEDWDILWDYLDGHRYRIGRYDPTEPYSLQTVWIEDIDTKQKLWEGYEDRLRELGLLL